MTLADLADAVKRSVSAEQAAKAIGLSVNRSGFCKCPLHGERTASVKLYPGTRGWYCFGCHQGGSSIDLVMAYYGMDLKAALEFMNSEFNLGLPIGYRASREQEEEAKRRAAEREAEAKRREAAGIARNAAFLRYLDVGAEIAQMERDKRYLAPKKGEEWHPAFKYALRHLDEKRDEAERLALECIGKEEE